ncbi:MAG: hypothetical protein QOF02_3250 [Blastocatellia bacterium]|jgi:hypothetical protein|nr:hypothetical protein [Blastocatellia bacterium]
MHLSPAQFKGALALLLVIWLVIALRLIFNGS